MSKERAFVCVNLLTICAGIFDSLVHGLDVCFQVVGIGKLLVANVACVFGTLVN